jgi:hypothetical protein
MSPPSKQLSTVNPSLALNCTGIEAAFSNNNRISISRPWTLGAETAYSIL